MGLTEAEAKDKGIPVKTAKGLMSANGRTVILERGAGLHEAGGQRRDRKLLGAQLMCASGPRI